MFLMLFACSGENKDSAQPVEVVDWRTFSPAERGPYNVGHQLLTHTYKPLSDQPERTIPIEIWYPTEDTTGQSAAYHIGVDETVLSNAQPAPPIYEKGYPVHLSSHGYQGWGANSAYLMSHFASHGWVVVAPNHINNTIIDHSSPLAVNHFIHRPKDLIESLNVVADLGWEHPIHTDEVVMSGHSFGAS